MTDEKRLEKIEKQNEGILNRLRNGQAVAVSIHPHDVEWMIKQTKLVPMYEKAAGQMNEVLAQINAENLSLRDRVQELEKRCRYLNNELFSERTIKNEFQQGIEEQGKRIKELEHVLAFYADKKSYTEKVNDEWGASTAILVDRGMKARQILRGKQNA